MTIYKYITLFLFTLSCFASGAQNMYSALHLNDEREFKTSRPKKIIETNTFFNNSSIKIDRNIKTFDEAGMLVLEERFGDDEQLRAKLSHTNDTVHRIILQSVFESWTKFGSTKEITSYAYDSNFHLTGTITKNENGNIIRQTEIHCNEKGHPIELQLFDGDGNSYGKEIATYQYENNTTTTSVIANDGRVLSTQTATISFINACKFPSADHSYNAQGDLTNWISRYPNGSETVYETVYTYDAFGNCTEEKIFKVTVKSNGKRKRKNDRIFNKQYFY